MVTLVTTAALAATGTAAGAAETGQRVEVTWTAHGIPHITSSSFFGLGYGHAYAAATLDICGLADAFATFSGTRSAVFGAAAQDVVRILGRRPITNGASDASRRLLNDAAELGAARKQLSPRARALARGFAAGFNRYVRETPKETLPEACRGNDLVRPITEEDVLQRALGVATLLSSGLMQREMFDAAPPARGTAPSISAIDRVPDVTPAGSNAYAFGRRRTGGSGLLFGNPHFFWDGPDRFMQVHLTVPGQYDAMGASLLGVPVVMIGFNASLAWTHTVSTDVRGTVHQLVLDPADPTRYLVDGVSEPMTQRTISFPSRDAEGHLETIAHSFWITRFGPVVEGPATPWDRTTAYAVADANIGNLRLLDQWLDIGRSRTVRALKSALTRTNGLPWVNTIAADRSGSALYADISVAPNIDAGKAASCGLSKAFPLGTYLMLLDGSRSRCAWSSDQGSTGGFLLAPGAKPWLVTDEYVENSNASHWLVSLDHPLEGFSPVVGEERSALNFRTRQGLVQASDIARITAPTLESLFFSSASLQADLVVPAVLTACRRTPMVDLADGRRVDLAEACRTLAAWDRRYALDSRGAHLFSMFVARLRPAGVEDLAADPSLWRVPFDHRAPLTTPRDFDSANARIPVALGEAVRVLDQARISLSARLADVQFIERGGARIPLHGGATFSALSATLVPGVGFTEPLNPSNSYLQVVTFDQKGPVADAILASSQSPDPESPFYADQTRLYSSKEWVRLPFHRRDVMAAAIRPATVLRIEGNPE